MRSLNDLSDFESFLISFEINFQFLNRFGLKRRTAISRKSILCLQTKCEEYSHFDKDFRTDTSGLFDCHSRGR